ncbi:glycerate kinase [Phototrophicus methaneseepsis]|uniref:glycerate kinase n=1 Tax=Phototrophicus methaneseepsis TaxID=2710758 RepID=UPI001E2C945F|nr:glycerate kinase [Phototrophicus methaneseepsis]
MSHILIAPGAFKHCLGAAAVAEAMDRGLIRSGLNAVTHRLPIADGGNGTVDAWLAQGGERVTLSVCDPLGRDVQADYGLLPDDRTAVIEMAQASGIELIPDEQLNPFVTDTYGTGQLMQDALERGMRRFIIGMGGSATVDGGMGALRALGVRLLDKAGEPIPHGNAGLAKLVTIDTSLLDARWQGCEIIIASDVENPTLGLTGAAAVFGPQKGATPDMVPTLEDNLCHFFTLIAEQHGVDVRELVGGGAAGALSASLIAFLGGRIVSGIDLLLEHNHFVDHLAQADLVITGEGRMDEQTIYGKGPIGVARLAREHGVPTVALVGGLQTDDATLHEAGLQAVLPIINEPMSLEDALANGRHLIEQTALRLGYLLQIKRA